jgi:hypothetical protein
MASTSLPPPAATALPAALPPLPLPSPMPQCRRQCCAAAVLPNALPLPPKLCIRQAAASAASGRQRNGSGYGCGRHHRAATACRHSGDKDTAATAMAGPQTTINNQLKATVARAMETATLTATMMTVKTKVTAAVAGAAAAAWQQCSGGGSSSTAAARGWRPAWRLLRQLGKSAALAVAAAQQRCRQWQFRGGSVAAVAAMASLAA